MPDRLAELRRQRALVAEHLAWLDREIVAREQSAATLHQPTLSPAAAPTVADNAGPLTAVTALDSPEIPKAPETPDASRILAELDTIKAPKPATAAETIAPELRSEHHPADIKDDVRRGCFLYLAIGVLLVVGGGALLIWVAREYNRKHPPKPKVEQVEEYQP